MPQAPPLEFTSEAGSTQPQGRRWWGVIDNWPRPEVERWVSRATWAFVALGLLMRVLRYLLQFPLWSDEAALAANLIERELSDLLRPLDYQQVAPPLFLWIELFIVRHLGFSEWTLRAFPFACSLASVPLFRYVAAQAFRTLARQRDPLLCNVAQLLAVAIFSVSYYPLRHGVEVKQYASDLLVALVLLAMALAWYLSPKSNRWLWGLAATGPIALALSHPAAFVAGGISLALVPIVWRRRTSRRWLPYIAYNLALLAAFDCLYVMSIRPQMVAATDEGIMHSYWAEAFPPLTRPLRLAVWCITVHCGQLFAYPIGGASVGSGAPTLLCCLVGTIYFLRSPRRWLLTLCFAPFVLTFFAAAIQRYPYGGYARTSQHLAPMICLLAGLGLARLIDLLRLKLARRAALLVSLAALATFGVGLMTLDLVCPYRTEHDRRVREFARWFWHDKAIHAELVCARADLRQKFFRQTYLWRGIAQYLCNQQIYSPKQARSKPDWEAISVEHPLRCVVFSRPGLSRDESAFTTWLAGMQSRFAWVGYECNDFHKPHDHGPEIERIEVYEFVPHADVASDAPAVPSRRSLDQRAN